MISSQIIVGEYSVCFIFTLKSFLTFLLRPSWMLRFWNQTVRMPVKHAKETAKRQMLHKRDGILIVRVSIKNSELTSRQVRGWIKLYQWGWIWYRTLSIMKKQVAYKSKTNDMIIQKTLILEDWSWKNIT